MKYFVVFETIWREVSKNGDVLAPMYSFEYLTFWDLLKEEYFISDFDDNVIGIYDDIKDVLENSDWPNMVGPHFFDSVKDAKDAISIIKVYQSSKDYTVNYHIVHSKVITVTYPFKIMDIKGVKF